MNVITAWIFATIVRLAPDSLALAPTYPEAVETPTERRTRLASYADDVRAVVFDEAEPPLFPGPRGRLRTAALLLAVAHKESNFAKDVDVGPACAPGRVRKGGCDRGASACSLQIQVGAGKTAEGWTKAELFADRKKCLRAGLAKMRKSFNACAKRGPTLVLSAYASGSCTRGGNASRARVLLGDRLFAALPAEL